VVGTSSLVEEQLIIKSDKNDNVTNNLYLWSISLLDN